MNYHNKNNNNIIIIIMQALLLSACAARRPLAAAGVRSVRALCAALWALFGVGVGQCPAFYSFGPPATSPALTLPGYRSMLAAPSFWRSNIPPNQQAARWPAPGTALAVTSTLINLFLTAFQSSRWLVLGLTACGYLQNGQKQAQGPFSGSGGGVGRVGRESARYRLQRAACGPHSPG